MGVRARGRKKGEDEKGRKGKQDMSWLNRRFIERVAAAGGTEEGKTEINGYLLQKGTQREEGRASPPMGAELQLRKHARACSYI